MDLMVSRMWEIMEKIWNKCGKIWNTYIIEKIWNAYRGNMEYI